MYTIKRYSPETFKRNESDIFFKKTPKDNNLNKTTISKNNELNLSFFDKSGILDKTSQYKINEKINVRENITKLASEKTHKEKMIADRLKKNLQVKNEKSSFDLINENRTDITRENAIKKAVYLEEIRNDHLNKNIKNSKPEVDKYYKIFVDNFLPANNANDEQFKIDYEKLDKKLEIMKDHINATNTKKEIAKKLKDLDQKNYSQSCNENLKRMRQDELENIVKQHMLKHEFITKNQKILEDKKKKAEKAESIKLKEKEQYNQKLKWIIENERKENQIQMKSKSNVSRSNYDKKYIEKCAFDKVQRIYKNYSQIVIGKI